MLVKGRFLLRCESHRRLFAYDSDMRWMLLVDTCGSTGGVAVAELPPAAHDIAERAQPMLVAQRLLQGRETQERLMKSLDEVLRECNLRAADLDALAVVTGPGSFTGVRIGLAAVKGLAESLDKPVVAISRLAALAAQTTVPGVVQAWIDAGRGDVFVGRYLGQTSLSQKMMSVSEAVAGLSLGETALAMEERVAGLHPALQLVAEPGLQTVLRLAWKAMQAGDFAAAALLDANYLRAPDAELHRLAAKAGSEKRMDASLA